MFHLNLDFILLLLSFFKSLIARGILLQQTQLTISMCIINHIYSHSHREKDSKIGSFIWISVTTHTGSCQ